MMETTPFRLRRCRMAVGAGVLLLAGLTQAAAQFVAPGGTTERSQPGFPPPPSQTAAFPPPPAQTQEFPAPGAQPQQSFPAPGAQPGGFSASRSVSPGGSFAPGAGPGGGGGGGPQNDPVCMSFPAIGKELEDSLKAVNDAGQRKAPREEACPLFKNLSAKEVKTLKFLETNRNRCQIPPNFIKQLADRHTQIVKITKVVCSTGPQPGQAAAPSLSDALGGPTIADDASAAKPGRGTFDTLTGNALQR